MYELSLTQHVMISSDQPSSLCCPTNLLGLHESQLCCQHFAIFQEDQLNFRRFPVFPGAVDTLLMWPNASYGSEWEINLICLGGPLPEPMTHGYSLHIALSCLGGPLPKPLTHDYSLHITLSCMGGPLPKPLTIDCSLHMPPYLQ